MVSPLESIPQPESPTQEQDAAIQEFKMVDAPEHTPRPTAQRRHSPRATTPTHNRQAGM